MEGVNLTTADLIALGGVLISVGVQLATISNLRERARKLEAGARSQGARLEAVNLTVAVVVDRMGLRRQSYAVPPAPNESGQLDKEG